MPNPGAFNSYAVNALDALNSEIETWAKLGNPALMQRFVARNGLLGISQPLPDGISKGAPRECFKNATLLAATHPEYRYCEGYGTTPRLEGLAIHHAWVLDGDENVIDQTWKTPERCSYMGVTFTHEQLRHWTMKTDCYGLLDTGRGINVALIEEIDPDLMALVADIKPRSPIRFDRLDQ